MRERQMGELVGERRREIEKERQRERRGSETDVPKLYTYNEYEDSVYSECLAIKVPSFFKIVAKL